MKSLLKHSLLAVTAVAALASCQENEVYDTQVTRELSMTLDGEPWNIYYGTSNLPLFIYDNNGNFVANYSTSYRFALNSGTYRVLATNQSILLTPPTNLDDQYIDQDPEAKQTFAISDPISYNAGDPMNLALTTRTGKLRLHATDVKADKSYSIIRAQITTPVSRFHVGTGRPAAGEPIVLERYRETAGGGVGYNEELQLIGSDESKVNVLIEYLDADSNIVNSKQFAEEFTVLPNQLTEVNFELNNPNEAVIINYNVYMGSLDWRENDIFPSVKVEVPDGFTYVKPDEDLNAVVKDQLADESISELRIFLKANSAYQLPDKVLEGITKPVTFMGQKPGYGQSEAQLQLYNITMEGEISHIRFENVKLRPAKDRLFNLRNQKFHVGEIAFVNCVMDAWNGSLWTNTAAADNEQIVDKVVMSGCRLTNMTTTSTLWNNTTRRVAPVYNWEFTNCLFHGRNFGTGTSLLNGLSKIPGTVNVSITGCTFIDTRGTNFTLFNIDGAASSSLNLTVTGNTVAGATSGKGTWFKLGKKVNATVSGNYRAKGYEMAGYGIDAPAESDKTYNDILSQFNL